MLVTIQGRLVRSHGSGETAFTGNGTIQYQPAAHGTHDGALRGADPVTARVTDGEAEAVHLTPGPWRISVFPEFGPPWAPFLVEITEDTPDPSQVADLAPVLAVDGEKWVSPDWEHIPGKPATYPPATHTHPITDVVGLQAIIDRLTVGTGWRDATSLSPAGTLDPAAASRIRRVGNTVYLEGNGSPGTALADRTMALAGLLLTLPMGFRASGYAPARGTLSVGYGSYQGILHTFVGKDQVRIAFPQPPNVKVTGYLNWSVEIDTTDPWPVTLPPIA